MVVGGFTLAEAAKQSDAASKKKMIEMLNHRRLSAAGPAGPVADLQSYAGRHCCHETPGKEKKKEKPSNVLPQVRRLQVAAHQRAATSPSRTDGRTDAGETEAVKSGKALKAPQAAASAGRHTTTATTTETTTTSTAE